MSNEDWAISFMVGLCLGLILFGLGAASQDTRSTHVTSIDEARGAAMRYAEEICR